MQACTKFRVDVVRDGANRYRVSVVLIGSVHYADQHVYRIILRAEVRVLENDSSL